MMLRYALHTIRDRKGGLGALLASCAQPLSSRPRHIPGDRSAGKDRHRALRRHTSTPLVVSADQNIHRTAVKHKGNGKTRSPGCRSPPGFTVNSSTLALLLIAAVLGSGISLAS
nr:hypothetical protein [Streptomyces finlayi]